MTCKNPDYVWPECLPPATTTTVSCDGRDGKDNGLGGLCPSPVTTTTMPAPTTTVPAPTTTVSCEEDMDCWDCTTMGNLICGPVTTVAVGPPPVSTFVVPEGRPTTVTTVGVPPVFLPETGADPVLVGGSALLLIVAGLCLAVASRGGR